jgi:hypothetical protein
MGPRGIFSTPLFPQAAAVSLGQPVCSSIEFFNRGQVTRIRSASRPRLDQDALNRILRHATRGYVRRLFGQHFRCEWTITIARLTRSKRAGAAAATAIAHRPGWCDEAARSRKTFMRTAALSADSPFKTAASSLLDFVLAN